MLGCCVLSLSRDLAEQLDSRRALEKKVLRRKQTVFSALRDSFQVWFWFSVFGDAFSEAAEGSSETVSTGACFLYTNTSCSEDQFIITFFFFLLTCETCSGSYMKET